MADIQGLLWKIQSELKWFMNRLTGRKHFCAHCRREITKEQGVWGWKIDDRDISEDYHKDCMFVEDCLFPSESQLNA